MKSVPEFSSSDEPVKPLSPHVVANPVPRQDFAPEIIMDREALGRLRRELFWTVGEERAHGILYRWGMNCGLSETLRFPTQKVFLNGLGDLADKTLPDSRDEMVYEMSNSLEVAEHQRFFSAPAHRPQCALMTGYLTGRISGQSGQSIYFLETHCIAKGDPRCRFVGRVKDAWTSEAEIPLQLSEEDNMALELKETREQLKLTKDRYQNLFEQASTPIFIVNPESGIHVDLNFAAEELTGFSKAELLNMTVFDVRPSREHQHIMSRMKSLLAGEVIPEEETIIAKKDGTDRAVMVERKLIEYGGQPMIQLIMRDVTALKIAEQKEKDLQDQLTRSEHLSSIGRLAASVAHEIKNPLGAIRNAIYYIKQALINTPVTQNDPEVGNILKLAEEEVDGAVRIIEELLDFSRVVTLLPRRTIINDLLEKIPSIFMIPDNINLVWDLDLTLPAAIVDPERLTQVISNIVTNAIQSMPNGGTLTIRTRLEIEAAPDQGPGRELVLISIEDTGCGIQPQHLKKIFEPLYTTKVRGTGLGLAITNNIIEKHGGAIVVTSQVEKGTCFTIKLPLHPTQTTEESYGNKENSAR